MIFLSNHPEVDPEKIGIIGICGFGGFGLNAAAIDTRIRATVTVTMYDMTRVTAHGYFDSMDENARDELRRKLNKQRTEDLKMVLRKKPRDFLKNLQETNHNLFRIISISIKHSVDITKDLLHRMMVGLIPQLCLC